MIATSDECPHIPTSLCLALFVHYHAKRVFWNTCPLSMPTEMPRRSQSVFSDSDVPSKVTVLTPIHLAMSECYVNVMRSKPSWKIDCSWHILVVKTTKHKHHCLDKKQALHPNHLHRCISTELASDETREVPSSKYLVGNAHNSPTKGCNVMYN